MTHLNTPPLVLASTSKYRRLQMEQLKLPFTAVSPRVDEDQLKAQKMAHGCSPEELAIHLAFEKAKSVKEKGSCIIGADQLVVFEGKIMGKPHTKGNASKMLSQLQNKEHQLVTGICVLFDEHEWKHIEVFNLRMRQLSPVQIQNYIDVDNPVDCAGAYKIESLGIALFEKIDGSDFSSIQGLPLIKLVSILNLCGFLIP